jgi:N-acyl homoserine lactone hydrolase
MTDIDLLLRGIPGRTDEGYLGQSSAALIDGATVVDTGSRARRPMLLDALESSGTDPAAVQNVLLTHLHFDHAENVDLFPNATVHVYGPELARVEAGDHDWATARYAEAMLEGRDVVRFDEGEVLDGIEAIHTPGHVEQHVSFVLEDDLTYGLTGDAVKNVREFVTRNPFTLYDDEVALETIDALAKRLDFVLPGHDTPFYVTETGGAAPCGDVDLGVRLQLGADSETHVRIQSERSDVRELPPGVTDVGPKQSLD